MARLNSATWALQRCGTGEGNISKVCGNPIIVANNKLLAVGEHCLMSEAVTC